MKILPFEVLKSHQEKIVHLLTFFFIFAVYLLHARFDETPNIYQGRDIGLALEILNGKWIWTGPDMSGGGHLPGPLYYYLLAIPLLLSKTLISIVFFQTLLISFSAYLLWALVKKQHNRFNADVSLLLFISSYPILDALGSGWNPAFMPIFIVLGLYLYFADQSMTPNSRIFAFFVLGCGMQIHMSIVIIPLILILGGLFKADQRYKSLFLNCTFLLIPSLPFLFWHSQQRYQGSNWIPGIESLIEHLIGAVGDFRIPQFFTGLQSFMFNDLVVIGSLISLIIFYKNYFKLEVTLRILLLLTTPLLVWKFNYSELSRYTIPFFIILSLVLGRIARPQATYIVSAAALATVLYHTVTSGFSVLDWRPHSETLFLILAASALSIIWLESSTRTSTAILLFLTFLSLPIHSHVWSLSNELPKQSFVLSFLGPIIQKTGWDYATFRGKTFISNSMFFENDAKILYNFFPKQDGQDRIGKIDFVLISILKDFKFYESSQALPQEIQQALDQEKLLLVDKIETDQFIVKFFRHTEIPGKLFWNNFGHNYQNATLDVRHLASDWKAINLCADSNEKCTLFFGIQVDEASKRLFFYAYGDPLGMTSYSNNPLWVAAFTNISLKIQCPNQELVVTPAHNLGHTDEHLLRLLAPFSNYFNIPCKRPLSAELFIIEGKNFQKEYSIKPFNPTKLIWDFND